MPGRLQGKVAMVTGGASGIGLAIARRFAEEGATVAVADIDLAAGERAASGLGGEAFAVACDVTDETSVEAAFDAVVARAGGLDAVVANAGVGAFSPLVDHSLEEWRRVVDICQTGTFLTIKHGGRHLLDRPGGGSITCIASLNAIQPAEGMGAYCAAKAAVAMLAQVAAMELGRSGVRVNTIAPGLIETPATDGFFSLPAVVEDFVANTTVGRHGQPTDVAAAAAYLASDEASFVSAALLTVDGGSRTGRYPDLPRHFAAAEAAGGASA
jgi:NAD(P)-dependent dehydrogenase (short-subunit alcohol dehydrogenase family)